MLLIKASAFEEDLASEVWIDGNTQFDFSAKKDRTIYFSQWDHNLEVLRTAGEHYLAIQLDDRLDPLPHDGIDLPSITSVACVASEEILISYFVFLEQFGRTQGFSYLVLPDTAGRDPYEKEVLIKANEHAPSFFVQKDLLNHEIPESKKEFIHEFSIYPQILIASEGDNLRKLSRWGSKYLPRGHQDFWENLEESRKNDFEAVHTFPLALQEEIFRSGVYAVDQEEMLPLTTNQITYLGTNENLKKWLAEYAEVSEVRQMNAVTIVDHMSNPFIPVQAGDVVLTTAKLDQENITQLVFPFADLNQEILIAKMLFGAAKIEGRNKAARYIDNHFFLSFSDPLAEGLENEFQDDIDSIGKLAISQFATPGLQVAVVKNGSLVYEQSMGFYTYDSLKEVEDETLYDLASLTKVMATLPAIALLIDRRMIQLDDSISSYLPEFVGSNKSSLTIRQLLAHNAGLKSYMPFWSMMMDGDRMDAFYYKTAEDEANDIRTYGFEPDPIMLDTLQSFIVASDLIKNPDRYRYSDLGFMILHLLVERVAGVAFDEFLVKEFYEPMGLTHTAFNPIQNGFDITSIAPTEYDKRFRNSLVWGEVHDRNAAVFGGISGHAGLFSNAKDMAKMMSMYLNEGYYGGRRYLSKEVLHSFNFRYFEANRRGLGWDKKDWKIDAASTYASDQSFGHTGFTGTMVWADPKEDLIFIFLSNRIYPDAKNNRISQYNIRTSMHDSIYQSANLNSKVKLN